MAANHLSRRDFLINSASAAKGSLLVLSVPAILTACREANESRQNEAAFKVINATLRAMVAGPFTVIYVYAGELLPSTLRST